jgi:hypothetical protein
MDFASLSVESEIQNLVYRKSPEISAQVPPLPHRKRPLHYFNVFVGIRRNESWRTKSFCVKPFCANRFDDSRKMRL